MVRGLLLSTPKDLAGMGAMAAEEVSIKWNIVLSNVRGNGSLRRGRPLQLMGVWRL